AGPRRRGHRRRARGLAGARGGRGDRARPLLPARRGGRPPAARDGARAARVGAALRRGAGDHAPPGRVPRPAARGGGAGGPAVRARLCDVVASWHGGRRPAVLEGESLQLAVARGAAYFGLARRGLGVRIGGGAARTYYLGLGDGRALCLVPRGMEEGEQREIAE